MRTPILTFIALFTLLFQTSLAYEIGQVQDSDGYVNLRALPSLKGWKMGTIRHGEQVLIWRSQGDFHLVIKPELKKQGLKFEPEAGWVHKSRLRSLGVQAKSIIVTADTDPTTNLREGPSSSTQVLAKVTPGQVLLLLNEGDWVKVRTASGQTGYIHSSVASRALVLNPGRALTKKLCQQLFAPDKTPVGGDYSVYRVCGRQVMLNKDGSFFKVQFEPQAGTLIGGFTKNWAVILAGRSHRTDGSSDLPGHYYLLKRQPSGSYSVVTHGFDFSDEQLKKLGVPLGVSRSLGI